jgi:secondary thiamine-phosphate synthase enzyme
MLKMNRNTAPTGSAHHTLLQIQSNETMEFIDITPQVMQAAAESGVLHGIINVQTRHTTTAIVINENEPLLLQDMKAMLERLAPCALNYKHDDFTVRTVNVEPDELPNGHSHCKALFLRSSESLNIVNGQLQLGRWQRIFLLELDRPRERTVSILILGT